jgi:DNA-binding NarL/FixJ family response regulator
LVQVQKQAKDDPSTRRVLLVDRQQAFGQALWFVLDRADGLECVGHLTSLDDLTATVSARSPDLLLVDVTLLGDDARTATEQVGGVPIVLLADHLDGRVYARAAEIAAAGVVGRDRDLRLLLRTLAAPLDSGFVIEAVHLVEVFGPPGGAPAAKLTKRELEVLGLLTEGLAPREIAERLCIGLHTARGYVKNVRAKLDARSALEAVARGREAGLV